MASTLQSIRNKLAGSQTEARQVCLLSKEEFDAIKKEALGFNPAETEAKAQREARDRDEFERKNMERRAHMAKLMALRQGAGLSQENEFEIEARENRTRMQMLREEALLNSMDEVKEMNRMVAYAKAAYVRERQVEEKQRLRQSTVEEEKRKDLMMEVERLRGVEQQAIKDERRKQATLAGSQVIVEQIQERELDRLKQKEVLAKEGEDMLRKLKQRELEEIEEAKAKVVRQKQVFEEMVLQNESQIRIREEKDEEEKAENEKIMQILIERMEKEAKEREEKQRKMQQKELETAKLREKQERAQDRNKEIDDLKARRAVEKAERAFRAKEAQEAAKKAQLNKDLIETRKSQALDKMKMIEQQAILQKEEFNRILEKQKELKGIELQKERNKQDKIKRNLVDLQKEIAWKEEKKRQDLRFKYEEGKAIKDKEAAVKKMLENVRKSKLEQLSQYNIPSKYQIELASKKF